MIALLDAASWFFQASHWVTSRAEIASVHSGIETSVSMSVPFKQSKFLVLNGLKMVLNPAREKIERRIAGLWDSERAHKVREVQPLAPAIIADASHNA